jgi:hypothetical protein
MSLSPVLCRQRKKFLGGHCIERAEKTRCITRLTAATHAELVLRTLGTVAVFKKSF